MQLLRDNLTLWTSDMQVGPAPPRLRTALTHPAQLWQFVQAAGTPARLHAHGLQDSPACCPAGPGSVPPAAAAVADSQRMHGQTG